MPSGSMINLDKQNTALVTFFDQYTGGAGTPTQQTNGYLSTDGFDGSIKWELWENNVAAGGSIIIEGSIDLDDVGAANAHWYPVGYWTLVSNGTGETSLSRASKSPKGPMTVGMPGRWKPSKPSASRLRVIFCCEAVAVTWGQSSEAS